MSIGSLYLQAAAFKAGHYKNLIKLVWDWQFSPPMPISAVAAAAARPVGWVVIGQGSFQSDARQGALELKFISRSTITNI